MNKHPVIILEMEYPSEGTLRRAAFVLDDNDYSQCSQQEIINTVHDFSTRMYHGNITGDSEILCDEIHSLAEWDGVEKENPKLVMRRVWSMPSHNTFRIKPIMELINRHIGDGIWLDPFSNNSPFASKCLTNDLNPDIVADYHMEALDFLKRFEDESVDGVLFDPPYSPRQISECYKQVGMEVHTKDTQSSFYGDRKKEVARVLKNGGKALCCGWNSGGIGKTLGMELVEMLVVPHGGAHNDTICTVEVKRISNNA